MMEKNKFKLLAVTEGNEKWDSSIKRLKDIDYRKEDIRTDFERDYNRILHCRAYRRLKNKTQVFFATKKDNICTRIEHVNHVASVSYTISKFLGLNTQLTLAIAIGHDLGHAPFGHSGERIIKKIVKEKLGYTFWHEKNSLRVIDSIETLEDSKGLHKNMNLTYAVRDGIVSHCGEVNENALVPRSEAIDLNIIEKPNQYAPYTWEGCVVKIADKISYLGRDIEDALSLEILSLEQLNKLRKIAGENYKAINNTILMHDFIIDLCKNSNADDGICFSEKYLNLINEVKDFNYTHIYKHKRLRSYEKYATLILNSIFEALEDYFDNENTLEKLTAARNTFPLLIGSFMQWLAKYDASRLIAPVLTYDNRILYDIAYQEDYILSIIDFTASLTDNHAIDIFNELSRF